MPERIYLRVEWESELGPGTIWFELEGESAVRQVERYGDRWFDSRVDHHPELGLALADQPLPIDDLPQNAQWATREDFEAAWQQSLGSRST